MKQLRDMYKLTQAKWAEKIGATQAHVSMIERGERSISFKMLKNIHLTTGLSYDFIVDLLSEAEAQSHD